MMVRFTSFVQPGGPHQQDADNRQHRDDALSAIAILRTIRTGRVGAFLAQRLAVAHVRFCAPHRAIH